MVPGTMKKRVTRNDVANKAGVNPSTVSRALNGNASIPEQTRERIRKIASDLGYVPSRLSSSFSSGKSYKLGALVPYRQAHSGVHTIAQEYFSQFLLGALRSASRDGYSVNIIADDNFTTDDLERLVLSGDVDGLFFLGLRIGDERPEELLVRKVPFVCIHHYPKENKFPAVDTDSESGMRQLFEHFLKLHVKSAGFLSGGPDYRNSIDRSTLFHRLCREYSINAAVEAAGRFSRHSGYDAADTFVSHPAGLPDVIVCANDRMAFGLIQGLADKGFAVPEDVRVTGFDNLDAASLVRPRLTTISNPFYEIGERAAAKLIGMIAGDKPGLEKLPSELVVRESC